MELVKALGEMPPVRIVYVSCSPATLARDAGVLVNVHGYRLAAAGVINMFPHTSHVESIAVFERCPGFRAKKRAASCRPFCIANCNQSRWPVNAMSNESRFTKML